MKGISSELLILLLFGAFMLFNFVMQRAAKKRQALAAAQASLAQDEVDQEHAALPPRAAVASHARAAPAVPAANKPRRFSRQALFGSRRAAQQAFVVATILGPCRADQPHEPL